MSWPTRSGRDAYSDGDCVDEKKVVDPRKEIGADVANLWFWQLGAIGLMAPRTIVAAGDINGNRIHYAVSAWSDTVYEDVGLTAVPWVSVARLAVGQWRLIWDETVPGINGELASLDLQVFLAQRWAQGVGSSRTEVTHDRDNRTTYVELRQGSTGNLQSGYFVLLGW